MNAASPWRHTTVLLTEAVEALVTQADEAGVKTAVFWDTVVHQRPSDLASPLEGRGRFHLEWYALERSSGELLVAVAMTSSSINSPFDQVSPLSLE